MPDFGPIVLDVAAIVTYTQYVFGSGQSVHGVFFS